MQVERFPAVRPPCSVAEREAAKAVGAHLSRLGLDVSIDPVRAPTSPTWAPLIRALCRVWAAAFLAAQWLLPGAALALVAVVAGLRPIAGLIRFVPLLGASTQNVVARSIGTKGDARPIVVVAHVDTHPTAGKPMLRAHVVLAAVSGWLALAIAIHGRPWVPSLRSATGFIAAEAVLTIVWLARRELAPPPSPPDDNTSGLVALTRVAELVSDVAPSRDVWVVATAAGMSGSFGVSRFLRAHPELRDAWVIEADALGSGELVVAPLPPRFPRPGTPSPLVRALVSASDRTGDQLSVRRVRRPHSDARAALRLRVGAVAITAGLRHPEGELGPDTANAERAARVIDHVARLAIEIKH